MNRAGVSMFFIYVDALDEMHKEIETTVMNELYPYCKEQQIKCMFTYIDAMTGEAIARNMGITDYPRVFGNLITPDGAKRLDETIDAENVSKSLSEKFKTFVEEEDDPADDEGYYYEEYDDEDMDAT